jgi:hypothetical protein
MDRNLTHKFIVISISLITIYSSYMTLIGISDVWHTSQSFFQGTEPYYPYLFTATVASVPFVLILITYLVHKNIKPILVLILTSYTFFVYFGYQTILLAILIVTWWIFVYKGAPSPNKSLNSDALR